MRKAKALRIAGFVGALCASAALVGTSVAGTGAYFSDSHPGTINASGGHLTLSTSDTALNFSNLMPGTPVADPVDYNVSVSSGGVDVWLTFDPADAGYLAFTGSAPAAGANGGGLGGFGYFTVKDSTAGTAFTSGNLAFPYGQTAENTYPSSASASVCGVNADGRGGSNAIVTATTSQVPWCGVPDKILLRSNVTNGQAGTITVTFGLNGVKAKNSLENVPVASVPFHIVATQHGQTP
jgi:hypothetical protein